MLRRKKFVDLKRSASLFFSWFITPRSENEDIARREYILNVLLVGALGVSGITLVSMFVESLLVTGEYRGVPPLAVFVIFAIFVALLGLSRFGFFRISAFFWVLLYLVPILYASLIWGIDLPQAIAIYALLIITTSVLIGTRFSMLFTFFLGLFLIGVTFLHAEGIVVPDSYWRAEIFDYVDAVVMVITFGLIAVVSWLSSREIDKSLARARQSEAELKEERDQLEVNIVERTRELRQSQVQQIAQMQRFVEFGRLASGLFHDIAGPLTALSFNLQLMKNDSSDSAQKQSQAHLEDALKTTKRLEEFLQSVRRQLQSQDVKVTFLLKEESVRVMELISYKAKKMGAIVRFSAPSHITMHANVIKFHQIVLNLLSNALDACVHMREEKKEPCVSLQIRQQGDEILLLVKDNGSGIAAADAPHIFEPFFTKKSMEHGMGIGLSTCKDVIEKDFHGSITFESTVGVGTVFTVVFPKYGSEDSVAD